MVLERGINYMTNIIRYDLHLPSTNDLLPHKLRFVNYFRAIQNLYMLFWLLKDALLACKRCPLRGLLTPFWSPIKHLLLYYFITNWFPVDYKPTFYMPFCRYLLMSCLKLCNDFSTSCLQIFEVLNEKVFYERGWWEDRYSTVLVMFLFNK